MVVQLIVLPAHVLCGQRLQRVLCGAALYAVRPAGLVDSSTYWYYIS